MLVSDHHKIRSSSLVQTTFELPFATMGDRGGQKRKIDDLMKGLNDVKATQQQQQQQQLDSLTTLRT